MKVKTAELTRPALDWAASKALGEYEWNLDAARFRELCAEGTLNYSTNWSQGGPIIDRAGILFHGESDGNAYNAWIVEPYAKGGGPTHLIAAMRCFVASRLGDEVDVPEELLNT